MAGRILLNVTGRDQLFVSKMSTYSPRFRHRRDTRPRGVTLSLNQQHTCFCLRSVWKDEGPLVPFMSGVRRRDEAPTDFLGTAWFLTQRS